MNGERRSVEEIRNSLYETRGRLDRDLEELDERLHRELSLKEIALVLGLSSEQVRAARRYIAEHPAEVTATYQAIRDRIARGNPPAVRAELNAAHARLMARLGNGDAGTGREDGDAGPPG